MQQRILVLTVTAIRLMLSVLDVAGLAFIGLAVSVLAGSEIDTESLSGQVLQTLSIEANRGGFFALAVIGVMFFALKAVVSVLLNLWIGLALARTEVERTNSLFSRILLANLEDLEVFTARQVAHALNGSASVAYSKSLNAFSLLLADAFLSVMLIWYMFVADPLATSSMLIYFTAVALVLQFLIGRQIRELSTASDEANVGTNALVMDVYENLRQIRGAKSRSSLEEHFNSLRSQLATSRAKGSALGLMPRYTLEIALAGGVLLLVFLQLSDGELIDPAVTAILLAGAFRLSTTVASIQSGWNQLNEIRGQSRWTLNLEDHLGVRVSEHQLGDAKASAPKVEVHSLKYRFPGSDVTLFSDVNFRVPSGGMLLVRGKSGRGKSTLADLLLGMRTPEGGEILVDEVSLSTYLNTGNTPVAYVPQHTPIIEGSVARNVSFQDRLTETERKGVLRALRQSELGTFVDSLQSGIDTKIGAGGHGMSGGQIQRLGLARALYLQPKLLILDEVTSALDESTSAEITRLINSLRGDITIIVISHKPEKSLAYDAEFWL